MCFVAIASFFVGWSLYRDNAPDLPIVAIELGGHGQKLPSGLISALVWDFAFIIGYGLSLWLGATAAQWVFWSERAAALARLARGAALVVIAADLVENLCLALAYNGLPAGWKSIALDSAATAATIKFVLLVPTAGVAVAGVALTLFRLGSGRARIPWPVEDVQLPTNIEHEASDPLVHHSGKVVAKARALKLRVYQSVPQARPESAKSHGNLEKPDSDAPAKSRNEPLDEPRWRHAYAVPPSTSEASNPNPPSEVTGFCLSGGGIRSGSVAMGALQTLRPELREASYLVSISGGGYTAGALAHLLTDAGDDDFVKSLGVAEHDPDRAYGLGSAELDHVRRHSSYLATTATQMLVALGVLARGLLATLVLLYVPAVALGVAAAWFYYAVPIAVVPRLAGTRLFPPSFILPAHAFLAMAVLAAVALLTWLVQIASASSLADFGKRIYRWSSRTSVFMTKIAVITSIGTLGLPILLWVSARIAAFAHASIGVGVGGSLVTVLITYLAGLASIGWRNRKAIKKVTGAAAGKKNAGPRRAEAVPHGLLQLVLVIVSVGVLCFSWLLLLGVATVATATDLASSNPNPALSIWLAIGGAVVVVILGMLLDESSMSLHPFYRRRLASAFATRAVTVPGSDPSKPTVVAVPYHPGERTTLSDYARTAETARPFPEIIFAAAAHLTGEDRTPAGLSAVSFTMSADWVGGPDVGWVRTKTLERVCSPRLRRDVTVQAAVAISGAAFASAMGRFARWYQIILAISGARLGAWLPNPAFLATLRMAQDDDGQVTDWTLPGLPRIRRGTYLLRELFNIHPQKERLLQVTDGGHYENLGIVELLRRRCTTIYCIDGGGDSPPTAAGLAEAIALAKAELGVRIDLNDPFAAEPGAGRPLVPDAPLAGLNATLSKEPVIHGTFTYPDAAGLPPNTTGHLYVARALLWPEMSYSLLSYAAQHPVFPHDSTGDQWFNDGQFSAYTQLGRELGDVVRQVRGRRPPQESTTSQNGQLRPSHV